MGLRLHMKDLSKTAFSVMTAVLSVIAVLAPTEGAVMKTSSEEACNGLWGRPLTSRGYYGDTALHIAARNGRTACAYALLMDGANPDAHSNLGHTPLHYAAGRGRSEVVELLLRAGANPEAEDLFRERPLHKAAYTGCLECLETLLRHGAEVDAHDKRGHTPLWWASVQGNAAVVRRLVEAGADVEAEDRLDHRRPLHGAARVGCVECVNTLLDAGADPYAKNDYGQTPKEVARSLAVKYLL